MTSRARFWRWAALVLGFAVLALAAYAPVPFLTSAPGPVFDVLGDYDGQPVVEISGARQYPASGTLLMTTVAQSGGGSGVVTVGSGLVALFQPDTSVAPETGEPRDDTQLQQAVFDASSSHAVGAAATYLDRPVSQQPVILTVVPGSPADGKLRPGDLIETINGKPARSVEQVGQAVRTAPIGTTFDLEVTREDKKVAVQVTSAPAAEDPQRPAIGVTLDQHYSSDFEALVTLDDVGGPSAGLMFAVAIVDKLTPENLLGGRDVAGTGTISGTGAVGGIGGIDKKMIGASDGGAELFLAPADNCADTEGHVPDGLQVVPVASLEQAVDAVRDWRSGRPVASCPVSADSGGNG